ncbi:GroES-like protein [Nemania sp. FL0916]|nr:GroES-like protein [Nemania sp. FL0916]
MSIQQLQVTKQGGSFAQVTVPTPKPGPLEICIRTRAVAFNPIDWKNYQFGAMVSTWPAVLGIECAGIVESVGDDVISFKPGDEVMAWVNRSQFNGAFQDICTARSISVAKKPAGLSFEEAAAIPVGFLTAVATVDVGLKVRIPGLSKREAIGTRLRSVLVLGGSSAVGSAAIQLLRLALPSATIIATSSAAHHDRLISLGATACFDRAAQEDIDILKAATPGGAGVDAIIDAVDAGAGAPAVYDTLRGDGPRLYSLVVTRPNFEPHQNVEVSFVGARDTLNIVPFAMTCLTELLERGKYKLPVRVEVVGKGLGAVEQNLGRVMQVSGTKLVLSL